MYVCVCVCVCVCVFAYKVDKLSFSAQEELTAMLTRQGFTRYVQRDTG